MTDPAHDAEQDAGAKKVRKVPKTMLFNNPLAQPDKKRKVAKTRVFSKELQSRAAAISTTDGDASDVKDTSNKARKVAKTKLEFSIDNLKDEIEKAAQTQEKEMLEQANPSKPSPPKSQSATSLVPAWTIASSTIQSPRPPKNKKPPSKSSSRREQTSRSSHLYPSSQKKQNSPAPGPGPNQTAPSASAIAASAKTPSTTLPASRCRRQSLSSIPAKISSILIY